MSEPSSPAAASAAASSPAAAAASLVPQYAQLQITIVSAKILNQSGMFQSKPDVLTELSVDGQPSKKTEVLHKTTSPSWNAGFTVLITAYSSIELKLCGFHQIRANTIIGQATLDLRTLLKLHNGKFEQLKHKVELTNVVKGSSKKVADLSIVLDGTNFDMAKFPDRTTANGSIKGPTAVPRVRPPQALPRPMSMAVTTNGSMTATA